MSKQARFSRKILRTPQDKIGDEARRVYEGAKGIDTTPLYDHQETATLDRKTVETYAAAVAQAKSDAGMDPTVHDPLWTPVMVRTSIAERLLRQVVNRRVKRPELNNVFPGHIVNLAVLLFVQKLEANDAAFEAYLGTLSIIIAKGGNVWDPSGKAAPPVPTVKDTVVDIRGKRTPQA